MNFRKVNDISNSIVNMIEKYYIDEFTIPFVRRGSYKLFSIYHRPTKTLMNVLSESNVIRKTTKKSKRPNYLDAYIGFNEPLGLRPELHQISMDDLIKYDEHQIAPIKNEMISQLEGEVPEAYFTISFSLSGLRLIGVRVMMLNEFKEEVYNQDWSHLIGLNYDDEYNRDHSNIEHDDIDISIKADKLHDEEEMDICLNVEEKTKGQ